MKNAGFTQIPDGMKVLYSPVVDDLPHGFLLITDFNGRTELYCGYRRMFQLQWEFGGMEKALDWAESVARKNIQKAIDDVEKRYRGYSPGGIVFGIRLQDNFSWKVKELSKEIAEAIKKLDPLPIRPMSDLKLPQFNFPQIPY